MATSGQIKTNTTYESYFWVRWSIKSQNVSENYTIINWSCGLLPGHKFGNYAIKMSAFTINGVQVYAGGTYSNILDYQEHTLGSGELKIPHNTDGTKTFTISSFTGWLYSNHNYSANGQSFALTAIPRKATITAAGDFTDVGDPSISFSNPGAFAMDVWIEPNPVGDHLCVRKNIPNTGSYKWVLTDAERDELRNACAGLDCTIRLGLYTNVGGTIYSDYKDKKFTITQNEATKPVVDMDVSLNNGTLPAAFDGMYIQGKSRVDVTMSADGKYNASIRSYSAKVDGKTYASNQITSDVLQNSGSMDIIGYAEDSRGFTGSASESINVIAYSKPLVIPLDSENAILCYRSDGNGNRIGNSTSVWLKVKRTYYDLSQKNTCALQWRMKQVSEPWDDKKHLWSDLIASSNTSTDEFNAMLPGVVFDLKESYTVQIRAIDDIGETDIKTFEVPTQDVALHLGKGGKNVSVGTYCDYSRPYTFYSDWEGIFDKGLLGSSLNYNVTDVLSFAETCSDGLTPIIINDSTNKETLPTGNYSYSVGIVHKRAADQYNVILMDYVTGKIAINVHLSGTWTGWKYITPQ